MPSENRKHRDKTPMQRQQQDRQRKRRVREDATKLQKLLQQVLENEERSLERNEVLKRDIKRVNDHGKALERRTEELRALKRNYEEEVLKIYPHYFRSLRGNYGLPRKPSSEITQDRSHNHFPDRVSSNPEVFYENGRRRRMDNDEYGMIRQSSSLLSFRPRPAFTSSPYDGHDKRGHHILPNFPSFFEDEKELDRLRKSTFNQRMPPSDPFVYATRHYDTLRNELLRSSDSEHPSARSYLSLSPEREFKVIPQVLALSPDGKVILLPMTVPFPSQDEKPQDLQHTDSRSNQPMTEDTEPFGLRRTPDGDIRSIATASPSNNDFHMHRVTDARKSDKKDSDHPDTYFIQPAAQEQYMHVSHNPQRTSHPMPVNAAFLTEEARYDSESSMPPVTSSLVTLSAKRNNSHAVIDNAEDALHCELNEEIGDFIPSSPDLKERVRGLLTDEERNATVEGNERSSLKFSLANEVFTQNVEGCCSFESPNRPKPTLLSQVRNHELTDASSNLTGLENYASNALVDVSRLTNGVHSMDLTENRDKGNVSDGNSISLHSDEGEESPRQAVTEGEQERREMAGTFRGFGLTEQLKNGRVPTTDQLEMEEPHIGLKADDGMYQVIATESGCLTEKPGVLSSPLTSVPEYHKEESVHVAELGRKDNLDASHKETAVGQKSLSLPRADEYPDCVDINRKEMASEEKRGRILSSVESTDPELSSGEKNHLKVVSKDNKGLDVDVALTATEGGDTKLEDERLNLLSDVRRLSLDLGSISSEGTDTDTFDSQALTGNTDRHKLDNKKASDQERPETSLAEDYSIKNKEKGTESNPSRTFSPRSLMEAGSEMSQISSDEGDDVLDDLLNNSLGLTSTNAAKRNLEHLSKGGDGHPDSPESSRSRSNSRRKARPLFGEDNVFGLDDSEVQGSGGESDDEISEIVGEKSDSASRRAAPDRETKETENGRSLRSDTSQKGGRMRNDPNTDDKVSKSISERIRKPGFWDHSDSEPEMDLIGQTAGKEAAGDDDFDFEFFN